MACQLEIGVCGKTRAREGMLAGRLYNFKGVAYKGLSEKVILK